MPVVQDDTELRLFLWEKRQHLEGTLEVCQFLSGTGNTNRKQLFISPPGLRGRGHHLKLLGSWFRKSQKELDFFLQIKLWNPPIFSMVNTKGLDGNQKKIKHDERH